MQNNLVLAGNIAGFLGILLCVVAGVARLTGHFYLAGMAAETLLQAGTAGVVIGCFLLLFARSRPS
jgi:hypothetical protein